jgi:hypothetical protein
MQHSETKQLSQLRDKLSRLSEVAQQRIGAVVGRVTSLWTNAYSGVATLGQIYDRDDPWEQWLRGPTERPCGDCLHLHGQIHRASEWRAAGIRPKSPDLECNGYNCGCTLEKVDNPSGEPQGTLGRFG